MGWRKIFRNKMANAEEGGGSSSNSSVSVGVAVAAASSEYRMKHLNAFQADSRAHTQAALSNAITHTPWMPWMNKASSRG